MNERDFVYWLRGYFEINNPTTLNKEQTKCVKDHLDLVFTNVTQKKGMKKVMPIEPFQDLLGEHDGCKNIRYC